MVYDVAIVGGGIVGTSTLYVLSRYSNIRSLVLLEKYPDVAQVVSNRNNNSQTLHFGDIETNYSLDKAKEVKESAEMMARYVEGRKHSKLFSKSHKLVLAVGKDEVERLEKRYSGFRKTFPRLKKIGSDEVMRIEPRLVEGRDPDTDILALISPDGYMMDFGRIAQSFAREAQEQKEKQVDVLLNLRVEGIEKNDDLFLLRHKDGSTMAKTAIVATGASSLTFANDMGYGKDLIILPVAGSFFQTRKGVSGKVYMMQLPGLPFAAIHADPEVHDHSLTRIGPVSKVLPLLEKGNYRSVWDFLQLFEFRWAAVASIFRILSQPVYIKYILKQVLFDIPWLGKLAFLRMEARKIIPSLTYRDLERFSGGGVRPQVVDTRKKELSFGESKILGEGIIFDITPSPGASNCLANAEKNAKEILDFLGQDYEFDQKSFDRDFR